MASVAGCVGGDGSTSGAEAKGGDEEGSEGDDANATDEESEGMPETAADPDLRSTDIVQIEGEPGEGSTTVRGEAAVEFAPDEVAVAGTIVGESGCHEAEIADVAVDDEGAFHVVVAAVDRSAPDRLCTQSLTPVGYELAARFDGGVPEAVTVVHDDAGGRETVATDRPSGE